jgi:membrane carboxypeptidase/penicillin-binding protein
MIGYNPNITLGIWSGYDDNSFITTSDEKTFAKYMWADIIEYYNHNIKKDQINYWYNKPDNIIGIELSPLTGFYGGFNDYTKTLYFKKHNIPWYIELFNRKKENNE